MHRAVLIGVLAVAVLAVGFALLSDEGSEAPPSLRTSSEDRGADAGMAGADATSSSATIDPTVLAGDGPDADGATRVDVVGDPTASPVVVQVWRGKEGRPAVRAEVFFLDTGAFDEEEHEDVFGFEDEKARHWSEVVEQKGVRFLADQDGRVEVPAVDDHALIAARLPGMFGFTDFDEEHDEVEVVTLRADETLTVRVVDDEGYGVAAVPVGVLQKIPFRLDPKSATDNLARLEKNMQRIRDWMKKNPAQKGRAKGRVQNVEEQLERAHRQMRRVRQGMSREGRNPTDMRPFFSSRSELRARRETNTEGVAVFRHFQVHREWREKWWPDEYDSRFEAVLLVPLLERKPVEFSGRPVPEEVLELKMPPVGSVALRTVDRDGRPFIHPVRADLRHLSAPTPRWAISRVRKEQGATEIVFPFVGTGLECRAHCRLDDRDFSWRSEEFLGPVAAGERVVHDLVVAPADGMLFGRLLDAEGEPLRDAHPTFLINCAAGRLEGEEIELGDDGRFHLPYQVRDKHRAPFHLLIRCDDVSPSVGMSRTLADLPKAFITDLGEIRVDALGTIARGAVVDDEGVPIEDAHVQLQRERDVGDDQPKLRFVDEAFLETHTDEIGLFELFGEIEPGRYRLRVRTDEHFQAVTTDIRKGQSVEIRLERKARVVGTVLAPEWMQRKGIRAELVSRADPKRKREDQIHDYQGNTYIYFDWVRPGAYDLTLRVQQMPDPFLRIDNLVLEPGQLGMHPRLQELDLGLYLHRFEVLARDERGQQFQPNRPLLARVRRPDGQTGYVGHPWRKGRVEFLSTDAQTDVIAMAEGHATRRTVIAAGRNELQIPTIPPVDVHFPGLRALAGQVEVQVVLERMELDGMPDELLAWDGGSKRISGWYAKGKYTAAMLDESDTARVKVTSGGAHRVIVRFGIGQGIRPPAMILEPITLRIDAAGAVARFTPAFDRKAAQDSIADAAQKIAANAEPR